MRRKLDKFEIQENQYQFPYHHIPYLDKDLNVVNHRSLDWGFKYFCYLLRIKELVEQLNPGSVLDVGCGEGRFLGLLNKRIKKKVGIDLAGKPVKFARAFHPEIEFHTGDAKDMADEFDVVTAIEVLEHIPDQAIPEFFKTLESRTRMGGNIIISIPTTVVPLSPKHYRHYTINLFEEQLKASRVNLNIKNVEYVYRSSPLLKIYSKMTQNKFWIIEIKSVRNFIWKLVKSKYAKANEANGEEMIVVLEK